MQKLLNYINKIGIIPEAYHLETYHTNYFRNVNIKYNVIVIIFDYSTYPAATLAQKEKMLKAYCNRYHYSIFNRGGFPGALYFSIMKKEDRENLENYFQFENASRDQCEKIIHEYTKTGRRSSDPAELNNKLNEVMQEHDTAYKENLAAIKNIA